MLFGIFAILNELDRLAIYIYDDLFGHSIVGYVFAAIICFLLGFGIIFFLFKFLENAKYERNKL